MLLYIWMLTTFMASLTMSLFAGNVIPVLLYANFLLVLAIVDGLHISKLKELGLAK